MYLLHECACLSRSHVVNKYTLNCFVCYFWETHRRKSQWFSVSIIYTHSYWGRQKQLWFLHGIDRLFDTELHSSWMKLCYTCITLTHTSHFIFFPWLSSFHLFILKYFSLFTLFYVCALPAYMHVYHVCAVSNKSEDSSPGTEVTDSLWATMWMWEPSPGPPEEQQRFLNTELSL